MFLWKVFDGFCGVFGGFMEVLEWFCFCSGVICMESWISQRQVFSVSALDFL